MTAADADEYIKRKNGATAAAEIMVVPVVHIKDENDIDARKDQIILFEKAITLLQERIQANDMLEGELEPLRQILNENDEDLSLLVSDNHETTNNTINIEGANFDRLSGFMKFTKKVCCM